MYARIVELLLLVVCVQSFVYCLLLFFFNTARFRSFAQDQSKKVGSSLPEAARLLRNMSVDLREAGLRCVEKIVSWVLTVSINATSPTPFLWNGSDYLLKMYTDLNFVRKGIGPQATKIANFCDGNPLLLSSDDVLQPRRAVAPQPRHLPQPPSPGARRAAATTAARRKRVTPFQAKRIAAGQEWRCACGCVDPSDPQRRGCLLDESYEIDHRVPLVDGGSNDESNLQALLRTHHQAKSSAFARGR